MPTPIVPIPQRFFTRVSPEPNTGCWLWTGSCFSLGYGQFHINRCPKLAHRVAYEMLVGPIPRGLELDHLCHVRSCVNPQHLRPATRRQNQSNLRGKSEGKFSSKHVGVNLARKEGKWVARIHVQGRSHSLGSFDSEQEAARAYRAALERLVTP